MYCTTLVRSRSRGIGDGLTYEAAEHPVQPGSLVRVPLRKQTVEGIVLATSAELPAKTEFAVKVIEGMLGGDPLLTQEQILLLRWMAEEYCCSLRQAVSAFLPGKSWSALLPRNSVHPRSPHPTITADRGTLTPAQEQAVKAMMADPRPSLLFGAQSSDRTAVYARLIVDAAAQGKQSILLVPEILLTHEPIRRFQELLPHDRIAVLHSRLPPRARRSAWHRIWSGEALLVVGSRSALLSPCRKIGLVIIDEEHEWTYKNEQAPRYHARETAEALCRLTGAKLVLGSATPSLESWARTKNGHYHLVRATEQPPSRVPARVRVIDLGAVRFGEHYPFSPPLLSAIRKRLERGEQSVLFLNRRGMASALLCLQCRRRILSPASGLPYTVHRTAGGRPYLCDHTTGETVAVPAVCPSCASTKLRLIGAGTERLEDILTGLLPSARVLRADSDTLVHPERMPNLLQQMEEGRADILLGTQSVLRGLQLPSVTLAAVLLADSGLSLPHFRAGERVFQILSQLAGSSGQKQPVEVIIQTFRPDAPEITAAAKQRTEEYLDAELKTRIQLRYPPAVRMIRFLVSGKDAATRAKRLHHQIERSIEQRKLSLTVTSAPTFSSAGRTWQVLLKGDHPQAALSQIDWRDVAVDVDPIECL